MFDIHFDSKILFTSQIKVAETGKRVKALLNDMVKPAIHLEAECLADWYKMAQTIFLQTQILEKDLVTYEDSIYELKDRLTRIKEELKSENNDPKKNVSSIFKESSMAVRKRLEISSNVKVSWVRFDIVGEGSVSLHPVDLTLRFQTHL